jgi:predicted alpha-1,2-mannosidase
MKSKVKKLTTWILLVCMLLSNSMVAQAASIPIGSDDEHINRTSVWSTSFEDSLGFFADTLDESRGSQNLSPNSSRAYVGDITYLVDTASITGNADYNASETKIKLFDRNSGTKYLTNTARPVVVSWSLTGKAEKAIRQYSIVSANDSSDRDPKSWRLYGKREADADWTLMDERSNIAFSGRYEEKVFSVSEPKAFSSYRLEITENFKNGGMTQFADIILVTGNPSDNQFQGTSLKVDISNGPGAAWNQKSNAGWTGSKALKASGSISGQDAYQYNVIYDVNLPVTANTYLKYNIFPSMSNGNDYDYQYTQMYLSVDLKFTDGTYLSDLHAVDQNRNGLDPVSQGDSKTLTTNQWNLIYGKIGSVANGKTIDKVLITYHKPTHDMSGLRDIETYFDDIEIYTMGDITYDHLSNYTNVLRGTNDTPTFSRGLTAPAVTMPHGFNFWAPATNSNDNKIYDYQDTAMKFITVSHEPSYWVGDRGTWQFMVNTDLEASSASDFSMGKSSADFSHDNEIAHAHYYSVEFAKSTGTAQGAKLELTPTEHGAVVRFTYDPGVTKRNVIFDCVRANGGITFDNSGAVTTFTGYSDHKSNGSKRMYVYGSFNAKAELTRTNGRTGIAKFNEAVVEMKIATSYISYDQARKNLELEIQQSESFDDIFTKAQTAWDNKLGVISDVKGATYEQLVTLYSNLYRLFAYPNKMSENTGTNSSPVWKYQSPYRADDAAPVEGQFYINNGFWDTYRTTWAAYGLLTPTKATEMLNGLVQHYNDQGWVPRWIAPGGTNSMVGTSSDVIFADAMSKGIAFDYEGAYKSAIRNAATVSSNLTNGGRKNLAASIFLGYTPGTSEDFSWSMEGYVNDYGIAQMAKVMADSTIDPVKKEEYLADYQYYINRSKNYVKLFDDSGTTYEDDWFKGKTAGGDWVTSNYTNDVFDPFYWGESYTETNAYNMAVSVPQDGQGLANLYGGVDALADKLDTILETNGIYNGYGASNSVGGIHEQKEAREIKLGQYGHSNQPSHHIIYMYDYAAQPWKTQKYVRDVLDRSYVGGTFGQGYIGDEDNGEMSAWYVFSALGFYPVRMGSDEFAIGSPLFDEVTVNLEGGKTLTVKANNNSKENVYIQSMKLNGADYNKSYLKFSDISNGGTIEYTMGSIPNTSWGVGEGNLPGSITAADEKPQAYDDLIDPKAAISETDVVTTKAVLQEQIVTSISGSAVSALVDNNSNTEAALQEGASIAYHLFNGKKAELFTITSGKAGAVPAAMKLYGAEDGGEWIEIAAYNNLAFEWTQYTRPFRIPEDKQGEYTHYKFVFSEGTVSEIELLNYDDGLRTRDDLGLLIQMARNIDQTDLLPALKDTLNNAITDANAIYSVPDSSIEVYTAAYNMLKKAINRVTGNLPDAYTRMEAEAFSNGNVLIDTVGGVPNNIGGVKANFWASYNNVLFKGNTNFLEMYYAAQGTDAGGYVEIYLDDKNSAPVGIIETPITTPGTGWSTYKLVTATLSQPITGVHDLYFVFRNDGTHAYVANVDWFRFDAISTVTAQAGEHGSVDLTSRTAAYNETISFNIDPDDGYVIDRLTVNNVDTGFKGNGSQAVEYSLAITQDTNILATFRPTHAGSVTPSAIVISTLPNKLDYTVGEALDLTGMVVTATFVDGTVVDVNDYEVVASDYTAAEGPATVVIRYGDVTATFDITVTAPTSVTPSAIRITTLPDKLVYTVGEALDLRGMIVTAAYSDGSEAVVHDYEVVPSNYTATEGPATVVIRYGEITATFDITVTAPTSVTPSAIRITTLPDKLVYTVGETLDLSGMVVTATFSDGSTAIVNNYLVVTQNPTSAEGTIPVVISYGDVTATFDITVNAPVPVSLSAISITTLPGKLVYRVGDALDLSGMVVTAAYTDGSTAVITGYQVGTANPTGAAGTVNVVISYLGVTASFSIRVEASQGSSVVTPDPVVVTKLMITKNPDKTQYYVGEAIDLSGLQVSAVYSNGVTNSISSYSVNSDGVTATAGTKTITVSYNGANASFTVTVIKPELTLDVTSATMKTGESLSLSPSVKPEDLKISYQYSSSNPSVASVSSDGKVTANSEGTAIITVSIWDGLSVTCKVTVLPEVKEIVLNATKKTLGVGEKFTLTHELSPANATGKVTYKSGNPSIATINSKGEIKAKKSGTVKITVTAENGITQTCTITVKKAPAYVKADKSAVSLKVKKTSQIKIALNEGSAGKVTYTSSNKSIVTVDSKGKVTGKKSGTAYITVKTYNGKTAKVKITVKK